MAVGSQWLSAQFNLLLRKTTPLATFSPALHTQLLPQPDPYGPVATPVHTPNSPRLVGALRAWRNPNFGPHINFLAINPKKVSSTVILQRQIQCYQCTGDLCCCSWIPFAQENNSIGGLGKTKTNHAERGEGNLTTRGKLLSGKPTDLQALPEGQEVFIASGVGCPTPTAHSSMHTHPYWKHKENGYLHGSVRSWNHKWSFSQKTLLSSYMSSW